jgi:cell division septal protein FtsQ
MVNLKKQKVYFRRKKVDLLQKLHLNFKTIVKFLVLVLLVGGIGFILVSFKYLFLETGYFIVKGIDVKLFDDAGSLRILSFKEIGDIKIVGMNIFSINLDALRKDVEVSHPEFKDVVVRRILPNKLVVQAKLRKAIAQIRSDRYYFIDEEGILLPEVKNFPEPLLPIVTGIGTNLAKVKFSSFGKSDKEKIEKALFIIKEMKLIEGLSKYKLNSVDTTDPGNYSVFLEESNVEIKMGNSDFNSRLKVLATVLKQIGEDIDQFKYIDLRFEDPIIGPRRI